MVRFSDMLGGSGEPDEVRAADSPYAELASELPDDELEPEAAPDDEPETGPEPPVPESSEYESPEAVLQRLEQYATSARAVEPAPPEPDPAPGPDPAPADASADDEPDPADADADDEPDPGDDFLPRARSVIRRSWSRKRHP